MASNVAIPDPSEPLVPPAEKEPARTTGTTERDIVATTTGTTTLASVRRTDKEEQNKTTETGLGYRFTYIRSSILRKLYRRRKTFPAAGDRISAHDFVQTRLGRGAPFTDPAASSFSSQFDAAIVDASHTASKKGGKRDAMVQRHHDSALVRPLVRYRHRRENESARNRYHRDLSRQTRLEVIQQIRRAPVTNWRAVLDIMRLRTPPIKGPWQWHARKISISKELADTLLFEPDHTIWDIHERSRCHIELHRPSNHNTAGSSTKATIFFSGNDEALIHAIEEVMRLDPANREKLQVHTPPARNPSNPDAEKTVQSTDKIVWFSANPHQRPSHVRPYRLMERYEDIPKPKKWTPQSLEAYVASITSAVMHPHRKRLLYSSGIAADVAALNLLDAAFADLGAYPALTTQAFKLALRFIESRGHSCRNRARELLNTMKNVRLPMDTSVYNVILEGNVKVMDLNNFENILTMMIRSGRLPNVDTWCLFLKIIQSDEVRRHIIKIMYSHGLLKEPSAIRRIATLLVRSDVRARGSKWPGIQEFLRQADATYGRDWASETAMNEIMDELGRMSLFASCRDLFDIMAKSRSTFPTTTTLNIVLLHARYQHNMAMAIYMLQRARTHGIPLNAMSYHQLFTLTFRLRKPNMMGLVWRFACLDNLTHYLVRSRVNKLIAVNGRTPRKRRDKGGPELPALPSFHQPNMLPELAKVPPSRRATEITVVLHELYQEATPETPLDEMLRLAWDVDSEVHKQVKLAKEQCRTTGFGIARPRKVTVPGIPIFLRFTSGERVVVDQTVTHITRTNDGDQVESNFRHVVPGTGLMEMHGLSQKMATLTKQGLGQTRPDNIELGRLGLLRAELGKPELGKKESRASGFEKPHGRGELVRAEIRKPEVGMPGLSTRSPKQVEVGTLKIKKTTPRQQGLDHFNLRRKGVGTTGLGRGP